MLRLTRILRHGELRKYCFEEYSRPEYLARAAHVFVDSQFLVKALHLNSSAHGIVKYSHGLGLTESTAWQDEAASRSLSGTNAYYSVSGTENQSASESAVISDILKASGFGHFDRLVYAFIQKPAEDHFYPFKEFRLEPIRTSGQIHVMRYVSAPRAENFTWVSFKYLLQSIRRNLNPIKIVRRYARNLHEGLERIHYVCMACGAQNQLFNKLCFECSAPRPKLRASVVAYFFLRAAVDMTYVLYVSLTIGFLVFSVWTAMRLHAAYSF